jgi:hypothetical protein
MVLKEKYKKSFVLEINDEMVLDKLVSSISFFDFKTKCCNLSVYDDFSWESIAKDIFNFEMRVRLE